MVTRRVRFILWWRRSGFGLRLGVFVVGAALLGLLVYAQRPTNDAVYQGSYLQLYLLVNFLIVVLCLLVFLVGRNVIKLVFDRRRRILGSQLRLKLVAAFIGLTLVPTTILFLLASGLLTSTFEDLFGEHIESTVDSAIEIARRHYTSLENEAQRSVSLVATELRDRFTAAPKNGELHPVLEKLRTDQGLFSLRVIDAHGAVVGESTNAASALEEFSEPPVKHEELAAALRKGPGAHFEERGANKFFRAYAPLWNGNKSADTAGSDVLVATLLIPPEVAHANAVIRDFYSEYEELKLFRNQLRSGAVMTLAMISVLLLFAALWFGFYLAREITVPIQRLAEGMQAVARGNYDVQVRAVANDEIGFLIKSFNKMTLDLKNSRNDGERRRVYIETILENLMISVVGMDRQSVVTSVNSAAVRLFGFKDIDAVLGKSVHAVFSEQDLENIRPALLALNEREGEGAEVVERDIPVVSQGRDLKVVLTAGKIKDGTGARVGTVLLFDDVTELSKAQHIAAWREVARRIAHEIKNPLTPIQLSAQRLEKLTEGSPDLSPPVRECVQAIVENVDSIKRLANEFSHFARMPAVEFKLGNLNGLVSDVLAPYAESHAQITFQFIADSSLPEILMDREQLRRVLINLVDNAIAALRDDTARPAGEASRIVLRTEYDKARHIVKLEVVDNGPGVPIADKPRIFEPYFSTRRDGTGLGLAIVTSIVSDHQGVIRVFDNKPRGAKFLIEFPERLRAVTQRRFAAV